MPIHRKTLNKCAPQRDIRPVYDLCSRRDRDRQELDQRQFLARQAAYYTALLLDAENAVIIPPVIHSPAECATTPGFTFEDDALWAERRKQAMDARLTASMQRVDEKAAEESKSKWTLPVAALAVTRELEKLCLEEKDERKEVTELKFTFAKEENGFTFGKSESDETQVTD